MSFEILTEGKNKKENNNLYPERASAYLSVPIEKIKKLEKGDGVLELNKYEKKELLQFENKLGKELENIFKIKPITQTFYPEYFLTDSGKEDFSNITGIEIEGDSINDISQFLFRSRDIIGKISSSERSSLGGRSRTYSDKKIQEKLENRMKINGDISVDNIEVPHAINLVLTPEKALGKIASLRQFKKKIKWINKNIEKNENGNDLDKAKEKITELYKRKTNAMIADQFYLGACISRMNDYLENDELTEEEKVLLEMTPGLGRLEETYARYDKFIHGASSEYDKEKQRTQIPEYLKEYVEEIEKEYIANEISKNKFIKDKNLDKKKIYDKNIDVEQFSSLAEELLDMYGEKSSFPVNEYNPDREGSAPDEKWQFIPRSEFKSMSVNSRQKIIKSSRAKKSIYGTFAVALGHEIEGHFVQNLNSEQLSLKLFDKVKGDRRIAFAEMGAMYIQDKVSQEIFGFKSIPRPYYIKAMVARLESGNYLDCVKAYYDSGKKVILEKKKAGIISDEQVDMQLKSRLKISIKSAKRLFRKGADLNSKNMPLLKSKDTVYLEQKAIMDILKKERMEKYAFVLGINLDTLAILIEIGIIDPDKIQEPKMYTLKIWDRIKDKYKLTSK